MPTETDLRAALLSLEQDAPTTDDVLAGLQLPVDRVPRRRRPAWQVTLPVAAATVVLAAAVPTVVSALHHRGAPRPTQQQVVQPDGAGVATSVRPTDLRLGFTVDPVPGYTITPAQVLPHLWQASVRADTSSNTTGSVLVFAPGAFEPATSDGKAVSVNGQAGYFGAVPDPVAAGDSTKLDAVTWQYAPRAWAMVRIDFGGKGLVPPAVAQAEELKIARAVHTDQHEELRVPLRVGYLPARVFAVSASADTNPQGGALGLADGRGNTDTAPFASAITIWVNDTTDPNLVFCPSGDLSYVRFTLRGHTGCFFHNGPGGAVAGLQVDLDRGHVEILVAADHAGIYSSAQLLRIAASITTAPDLASPDTWFDARTALP